MKMQGNAAAGPSLGKLSVLERALSKKQAPMKTVKAMPKAKPDFSKKAK